uniref:Striatin 1 n=1 Tax=Cryptocotyle lingua TaxID=66766 RepID=A0A7U0YES7_9TREM|nr:striatin 1 [Cryptocotyle lingua]
MDTCFVNQVTSASSEKAIDCFTQQNFQYPNSNGLYTLNGVLDYLQSEWAKMEMERTEWEVERAELQARIAFLQGECKGQENLKSDLVRRIKMLEYALLQERNKNFELKYPNETRPALHMVQLRNMEPTESLEKGSQLGSEGTRWREERLRLKDYLISAGLGDAMDQLRQTRVQDLLAMVTSEMKDTELSAESSEPDHDDSDHHTSISVSIRNLEERSSFVTDELLQSLPDLDPSVSEFGDGWDVTDPETAEALAEFELLVAQQSSIDRVSSAGETRPNKSGDLPDLESSAWLKEERTVLKDWDAVDEKEMLTRFKEQYRAERSRAPRPGSRSLDAPKSPIGPQQEADDSNIYTEYPITSLNEDIDVKRPVQSGFPSTTTSIGADDVDDITGEYGAIVSEERDTAKQQAEMLNAQNISTSVSPTGVNLSRSASKSPASVSASLGLGDLASLTVANESESGHSRSVTTVTDSLDGVDELLKTGSSIDGASSAVPSATASTETPPWTAKYTLRSHFDAIRAISFHPVEAMLVTASEDHTLKLWNLNKTVQAKKSTNFDVEPVYTFRGHDSPVLSLATYTGSDVTEPVGSSSMVIFSGDLTGQLRTWRLSNLRTDPYDAYDPAVAGPLLRGHTDAIWSMFVRPDGLLLSASSDGTACLWSTAHLASSPSTSISHPSHVFPLTPSLMVSRPTEMGSKAPVPTSISFVHTEKNHFLSGFTSGHIGLFDVETNQLVSLFHPKNKLDSSTPGAVTSVVVHPQQSLVISAYEDRHIRFYDLNSGKCVHGMVAHLDSVTSLSLDPQGAYLISASHDCSIRLWNINKRTCIQEITSHRKKFGESIHAVAFHPSKHFMASAGADALAKVFV